MEVTHRIVRIFKSGSKPQVISRHLELSAAKGWLANPNSRSSTATEPFYQELTVKFGPWRDTVEIENPE